jgi:hypothetical protein
MAPLHAIDGMIHWSDLESATADAARADYDLIAQLLGDQTGDRTVVECRLDRLLTFIYCQGELEAQFTQAELEAGASS